MQTGTAHIVVGFVLTLAAFAQPPDPRTELDRLDSRTPVSMPAHMALHQKQNMREHLEAVQGIVASMAEKDYKAIANYAAKMGLTPQMGQMCQRMGSATEGFSEAAIRFHKSADQIVLAAQRRDQAGVVKSLKFTLTQCTSCHAMYRQQVVDEATFQALAEKRKGAH